MSVFFIQTFNIAVILQLMEVFFMKKKIGNSKNIKGLSKIFYFQ